MKWEIHRRATQRFGEGIGQMDEWTSNNKGNVEVNLFPTNFHYVFGNFAHGKKYFFNSLLTNYITRTLS